MLEEIITRNLMFSNTLISALQIQHGNMLELDIIQDQLDSIINQVKGLNFDEIELMKLRAKEEPKKVVRKRGQSRNAKS